MTEQKLMTEPSFISAKHDQTEQGTSQQDMTKQNMNPFNIQFDLHLSFSTATAIGYNK